MRTFRNRRKPDTPPTTGSPCQKRTSHRRHYQTPATAGIVFFAPAHAGFYTRAHVRNTTGPMTGGPAPSATRRNLAGWLAGNTCSLLADSAFELTLTWAAIDIGPASQVGLVLAAMVIPRIILLPFGGLLADRASPKTIIIGVDAGRAAATLALVAVFATGEMTLPVLVGYAILAGGLSGLFQPAVDALPARILPRTGLGRVGPIQTTLNRGTMLAGAPMAGGLLAWHGPPAAFTICGLLFAGSAAALAVVHIPHRHTIPDDTTDTDTNAGTNADPNAAGGQGGVRQTLADLAAGWTTMVRKPVLGWAILLNTAVNLGFSGPVTVGIPLLASLRHWGPSAAGILLGVFAAGAMATATVLTAAPRPPRRAGTIALAAAACQGAALATVGLSPGLAVAVTVAAGLGIVNGFFGSSIRTLLYTNTPESGIGRVMAMHSVTQNGINPASFAATGAIIAAASPAAAFLAGGALTLAAALAAASRPSLRRSEVVVDTG